ncbi:MAG: helix-turn-helix transcriptional regulator [Clostridia bacterium]|nr:helix-turn-helix transcriptional regulator [Clostridia bacterium]
MSRQWYTVGAARTLTEGNYNTYVCGTLHPTRTMAEHDLVYFVSGGWVIGQDGTEYTLQTDDVLLLHAGVHHYGVDLCTPGTETMYLHVTAAAGDGYERGGAEAAELATVIHCHGYPRVKELFSDILFARISGEYGAHWRIQALFDLLLLELHRACQAEESREDELVAEVIRFLQRNPSEHYSLSQLAQRFYVNGKTLDRRFQKACGKSVYRYQRDLKLEAVKAYMDDHPTAPLREVARNYGFYDEFHLSRTFKEVFGLSPSAYRSRSKG